MRIHWLASYPKSGNTWVRFLLHHYLYGAPAGSADIARRIPDLQQGPLPAMTDGAPPLLVKTHRSLTPEMPHAGETAGAIYIVRHPKDVLLSVANFYRLRDPGAPWKPADLARLFIKHGGDPSMAQMGFGTWVENVTTWTIQQRVPALLVRYEDLQRDAAGQLRRMLAFLGHPVEEQRLADAVAGSTFDAMRALEVREKKAGVAGAVFDGGKPELDRGLLFMNKGQSGQSLASIDAALDAEFDRRFRAALWLLGYAD